MTVQHITFAEYRAVPAVNASSLKAMILDREEAKYSAAAYHHIQEHPRTDTAALAQGRAFHCAALEPLAFPTRYLVYDGERRGKDWTDFHDSAPAGAEILTRTEYDAVVDMAEAVLGDDAAARLLTGGEPEQTITWTDEVTGLPCKCRADYLGGYHVTDLKSTKDVSTRELSKAIYYYAYDVQAAHYLAGHRAEFGTEAEFWFVWCSKEEPREVRVGRLCEDAVWAGEELRRELLSIVAACTESGTWPRAYGGEDVEFDLPAWAYPSVDEVADRVTVTRGES